MQWGFALCVWVYPALLLLLNSSVRHQARYFQLTKQTIFIQYFFGIFLFENQKFSATYIFYIFCCTWLWFSVKNWEMASNYVPVKFFVVFRTMLKSPWIVFEISVWIQFRELLEYRFFDFKISIRLHFVKLIN